jgi:hypothetical protein
LNAGGTISGNKLLAASFGHNLDSFDCGGGENLAKDRAINPADSYCSRGVERFHSSD